MFQINDFIYTSDPDDKKSSTRTINFVINDDNKTAGCY